MYPDSRKCAANMAQAFGTFAIDLPPGVPDVVAAANGAGPGPTVLPETQSGAPLPPGFPGGSFGSAAPPSHHRRSSTYVRLLQAAGKGADNDFAKCLGPPPPYLRGNVRRWYVLKAVLARRVLAIVQGAASVPPTSMQDPEDLASVGAEADAYPSVATDAYEGIVPGVALRDAYGFQPGPLGAASTAAQGLVADLCGCGGAVPTPDDAIALLHEEAFENYNRWARMVRPRIYGVGCLHCPQRCIWITRSNRLSSLALQSLITPPPQIGATPVYSRRFDRTLPRTERLKVAYVHITPPAGARHKKKEKTKRAGKAEKHARGSSGAGKRGKGEEVDGTPCQASSRTLQQDDAELDRTAGVDSPAARIPGGGDATGGGAGSGSPAASNPGSHSASASTGASGGSAAGSNGGTPAVADSSAAGSAGDGGIAMAFGTFGLPPEASGAEGGAPATDGCDGEGGSLGIRASAAHGEGGDTAEEGVEGTEASPSVGADGSPYAGDSDVDDDDDEDDDGDEDAPPTPIEDQQGLYEAGSDEENEDGVFDNSGRDMTRAGGASTAAGSGGSACGSGCCGRRKRSAPPAAAAAEAAETPIAWSPAVGDGLSADGSAGPPLAAEGGHAADPNYALPHASAPQELPLGADPHTRLLDLCLLYCIRAEAANLRFMPE